MTRRLLYIVLLSYCIACDNSKGLTNQADSNLTNNKTEIEDILFSFGDYEVDMATQLLCKRYWVEQYFLEYNENWDKILFNSLIDLGNGHTSSCFIFHDDGMLEDFTDAEDTPEEEYRVRTWAFNPKTRTLTIDGALNYHLIALGEDTFIWDYVSTGAGSPRYFRQVFKAQAIE